MRQALLAGRLAPPALAQSANINEFVTHPIVRKFRNVLRDDGPIKPFSLPRQDSALSQALSRAWKRDLIEESIAETKNTLLQFSDQTRSCFGQSNPAPIPAELPPEIVKALNAAKD